MFKVKDGKSGLEFYRTDKEGNILTIDRSPKWKKLREKTELKEMYIVRYADDFKIFCRDYVTAKKAMYATKLWLAEHLHLQTSDEKSGITNLRKNYTTFGIPGIFYDGMCCDLCSSGKCYYSCG